MLGIRNYFITVKEEQNSHTYHITQGVLHKDLKSNLQIYRVLFDSLLRPGKI